MNDFIKLQEEKISIALNELGYHVDQVKLNVSSMPDLSDYQYNGAMSLAKEQHKNPREIAQEIIEKMDKEDIEKITVDGPGFINITFKNESLVNYIDKYTLNKYENNDIKVVMDYGGPNVAKALHVGHLRSANIGEALKRLARFLGYNVTSDIHLGDWGRPLGLVILELKKRHPDWVYFDENYIGKYPNEDPVTNKELEELYPFASNRAKEDESYLEEARVITTKLQNKEKGYYDLWKKIVKVSVDNIKYLYDKLNVSFDLWNGESDSDQYVLDVVKYLEDNNYTRISENAEVVDVAMPDDKLEIPPLLLIKSNKSVSYETTDLATIWDRVHSINPNQIWYVVDNRQSLHFEQVFRTCYKSKIVGESVKLEHLGFGTMNGKDGRPFKTRDGSVMTLESLIKLVKDETLKKMNKEYTDEEKNSIADDLSIAALKYADLLPVRSTDYIFDVEKFCDLNGKTGVYLLYSVVRMKSLIKKAKEKDISYNKLYTIKGQQDRDVLIKLLQVDNILNKSMEDKSLNYVTDYLYQLAKVYNSFYDSNKVLVESNKELQESWLILTSKVIQVMSVLIDILGINIPDKI